MAVLAVQPAALIYQFFGIIKSAKIEPFKTLSLLRSAQNHPYERARLAIQLD